MIVPPWSTRTTLSRSLTEASITTFQLIPLLLLPFVKFSLPRRVLQVSTTPAPPYPPSASAPLSLEEQEARDPVPRGSSSGWDQPRTQRVTPPLSACLPPPPPPLPASSFLVLDWPSRTGREQLLTLILILMFMC